MKGDVQITHFLEPASEDEERNYTATIQINLRSDNGVEPGLYNWAVHDLPVEYTQSAACDKGYIGEK